MNFKYVKNDNICKILFLKIENSKIYYVIKKPLPFHWNANSHDLIYDFIMLISRLTIFNTFLQQSFLLIMKIIKKIDISSRNILFSIFPDTFIVTFIAHSSGITWDYSCLQYRILYMWFFICFLWVILKITLSYSFLFIHSLFLTFPFILSLTGPVKEHDWISALSYL